MKLELKHLSPYLPYDLALIFEKSGRIIQMQSCFNNASLQITDQNEGNTYDLSIWNFKPMLRPLSQLTEEIEHNGEKFVPYTRLQEYLLNRNFDGVRLYQNRINTNTLFWTDAQLLFEWHFDVFGLIEQNLAIPKT